MSDKAVPLAGGMGRPPGRRRRGGTVSLAIALAVGLAPLPGRSATTPGAGPGPTSSTVPATTPGASQEMFTPLPKAKTLEDGLRFSPKEWTILRAVDDRKAQLDEEAAYVLFRRAASLPYLSPDDFNMLGQPTGEWLRSHPDGFRGQPVRLQVYVFEVMKFTGTSPSWWPEQTPVWQLHCERANARRPGDEPLILVSLVDPTPLLGKPGKVLSDGTVQYPRAVQVVDVAGVFYKTIEQNDQSTPPVKRRYPVIVVWQMKPGQSAEASTGEWKLWSIFGGFLLLAFGWFFIRRRLSQSRRERDGEFGRRGYRPMRDQTEDEPRHVPLGEVDPKLRAAVEEYRKKRRSKDAEDGSGRSGGTQL